MDIGAIIVEPASLNSLEAIRAQLEQAARKARVDVASASIAFSAHREIGERVIVHLGLAGDTWDPFVFWSNHEALVQEATRALVGVTSWICLRERRSCGCTVVHNGETFDDDESERPLKKMARELGVRDFDLLLGKLELPDTKSFPLASPLPPAATKSLEDRLPAAPLSLTLSTTQSESAPLPVTSATDVAMLQSLFSASHETVQIAGRSCQKCDQKIIVVTEGIGCSRCGLVAHRACIGDNEICPSCNASFAAQELAQELRTQLYRKQELDRQFQRSGRQVFWIILPALIVLSFVIRLLRRQ